METKSEKPQVEVTQDACKAIKSEILDIGEPIDAKLAGDYVRHYLQAIGDPTGTGHNFGYLFGFKIIERLVDEIRTYNAGGIGEPIEGVRVYLGKVDEVRPGEPVPLDIPMDTIFLIGVLGSGHDIPTLKLLTDPIIAGKARPCPNECLALSAFSE